MSTTLTSKLTLREVNSEGTSSSFSLTLSLGNPVFIYIMVKFCIKIKSDKYLCYIYKSRANCNLKTGRTTIVLNSHSTCKKRTFTTGWMTHTVCFKLENNRPEQIYYLLALKTMQ